MIKNLLSFFLKRAGLVSNGERGGNVKEVVTIKKREVEYGNSGLENRSIDNYKYDNNDNKVINNSLSKVVIPDDCGKDAVCNSTLPLCFVDENGFSCKSRNSKSDGWHLDPTSGLKFISLNQKPPELDESCIIFKRPTNESHQNELKQLLKDSIFGKNFGNKDGVWQDSLSFIGNCKDVFYCDNSYNITSYDGICTLKLSNDDHCTSVNQCFSHRCSNSDDNSQNTNNVTITNDGNSSNSSLVCTSIDDNGINKTSTGSLSPSSSPSPSSPPSQYYLLIATLTGVGFMIILMIAILIYKKFKKNKVNNSSSKLINSFNKSNMFKRNDIFKKKDKMTLDGFVVKPLSTTISGNLISNSNKSSEIDLSGFSIDDNNDNDWRNSISNSDNISILLPSPPPIKFHNSYLFNENDNPDQKAPKKPFVINKKFDLEEDGIG